jgi:hypothetical protein
MFQRHTLKRILFALVTSYGLLCSGGCQEPTLVVGDSLENSDDSGAIDSDDDTADDDDNEQDAARRNDSGGMHVNSDGGGRDRPDLPRRCMPCPWIRGDAWTTMCPMRSSGDPANATCLECLCCTDSNYCREQYGDLRPGLDWSCVGNSSERETGTCVPRPSTGGPQGSPGGGGGTFP